MSERLELVTAFMALRLALRVVVKVTVAQGRVFVVVDGDEQATETVRDRKLVDAE